MVSTSANSSTDPRTVLSLRSRLADILGNARRSRRFEHQGPLDRPMTGRDEILEHHTLVMRDGRILDLLPTPAAAERYAPRVRAGSPDAPR